MVHDPGALPLAIRFHAFSVKRKPLLTAHCSLLTTKLYQPLRLSVY